MPREERLAGGFHDGAAAQVRLTWERCRTGKIAVVETYICRAEEHPFDAYPDAGIMPIPTRCRRSGRAGSHSPA